MRLLGERLSLRRVEASEAEHADLRLDVAPLSGGVEVDEGVVELVAHADDAVSHALDLALPLPVSQDPGNYSDAPTEGIRRVLETVTGEQIPRGSILNTDKIGEHAYSPISPNRLHGTDASASQTIIVSLESLAVTIGVAFAAISFT